MIHSKLYKRGKKDGFTGGGAHYSGARTEGKMKFATRDFIAFPSNLETRLHNSCLGKIVIAGTDTSSPDSDALIGHYGQWVMGQGCDWAGVTFTSNKTWPVCMGQPLNLPAVWMEDTDPDVALTGGLSWRLDKATAGLQTTRPDFNHAMIMRLPCLKQLDIKTGWEEEAGNAIGARMKDSSNEYTGDNGNYEMPNTGNYFCSGFQGNSAVNDWWISSNFTKMWISSVKFKLDFQILYHGYKRFKQGNYATNDLTSATSWTGGEARDKPNFVRVCFTPYKGVNLHNNTAFPSNQCNSDVYVSADGVEFHMEPARSFEDSVDPVNDAPYPINWQQVFGTTTFATAGAAAQSSSQKSRALYYKDFPIMYDGQPITGSIEGTIVPHIFLGMDSGDTSSYEDMAFPCNSDLTFYSMYPDHLSEDIYFQAQRYAYDKSTGAIALKQSSAYQKLLEKINFIIGSHVCIATYNAMPLGDKIEFEYELTFERKAHYWGNKDTPTYYEPLPWTNSHSIIYADNPAAVNDEDKTGWVNLDSSASTTVFGYVSQNYGGYNGRQPDLYPRKDDELNTY